jgi:hypothetical protein
MRGRWGRGFAIALALAAPAEVVASSEPSEGAGVFEAASVVRHLQEWPEANVAARERAQQLLGEEKAAALLREVYAAFEPARLLERVTARLAALDLAGIERGYAESGAAGLLGDARGFGAAELRDLPDFASRASRGGIEPARLLLVARLDESTGFGLDAWRVTRAWGDAIELGARALACEPVDWSASPRPDPALAEAFRERVHVELLFLTRKLGVSELRRTVRFLESAPAREFRRTLAEATSAALASAREELAPRIATLVRESCSDRGQPGEP